MRTTSFSRQIPWQLRGAELVHPWIYPWFAVAALALGIPAAVDRPVGAWLALSAGICVTTVGALALWLRERSRRNRAGSTAITLVLLVVTIAAAAAVTELANPQESFPLDAGTGITQLPLSTSVFLTACLIIVWSMLWVLIAVLVSGQRSYRRERNELRRISNRIRGLSANYVSAIAEPAAVLQANLAENLRQRAEDFATMSTKSPAIAKSQLLESLKRIRDELVTPALEKVTNLEFNDDPSSADSRHARVNLPGIPFRWNATYFSGLVGALVIGVVAISASASINFTSPGFLIQIPLIVLAFFVSVPASLLLFFAAALTPFLGPNSLATENFALFVIIALLALMSFLHRANEVRQIRVLEGLSVANAELSLETVRVRQESIAVQKSVVSTIHGKIQSSLVAAIVKIDGQKSISPQDITFVSNFCQTSADELTGTRETSSAPDIEFSTAIADVIALWNGSLDVEVSITPESEALLIADRFATATAIEVISEATLNAAKHAQTTNVIASITSEGSRVRVTVTNPSASREDPSPSSTRIGLQFLRQLTTELRLEMTEHSTMLIAEIPTRLEV